MVDDHPYPYNTPGDNGPSEGTGQEEGEVGVVLDAIIASPESEPAQKGVSAIEYAGQMQDPANSGEHAEDDTSPPVLRSAHPSASTGDCAFDPSNPLSGQFEGVRSVGVHNGQIGVNYEEGIDEEIEGRIERDSNGSHIEMQEMSTTSRDDVH